MPSYVSHTIMANDVYDKLKDKNVNLDYMITYSLGGDLSKFAKCRYESHRLDKRDLFYKNMIEFIKKNNLEKDPKILGVLYGHICHYAFDDLEHPLIRKLCKKLAPNKKNHALLELYYDNYLTKKKHNIPLNKYDNKKLFKGKMTKEIKNMINYAYYETFNCKNVARYYKFNLFLYKKIRLLYLLLSIKTLRKFVGIDKFLETNKGKDIFNNNHEIVYQDINGNKSKDDFDTLYEKAVKKAINDIESIRKRIM